MSGLRDSQLMSRVQAGDHDAFAALVDRYKDAMVGYLCRLTGSRDSAEDLAQETFFKLYTHAADYSENGHLRAYLFRIATNLARSEARKKKRRPIVGGLEESAEHGGELATGAGWAPRADTVRYGRRGAAATVASSSPHLELLHAEAQREIVSALAALPMHYRVPVVLHDIEEWTYEEIARVTGEKTGTVKSRISRGRRRLREALEPTVYGVTS